MKTKPTATPLLSFTFLAAALLALAAPPAAHAGIGDLKITEVDPANDRVQVTHQSESSFTTASPLPFCHRFNYSSTIPSGTEFGPDESKTFTVSGLNDSSSDIWLYRDNDFASSDSILTGVAYGAGNLGRAGVAAAAGIWPSASTFLPTPGSDEVLRLTGANSTNPEEWEVVDPQQDGGGSIPDPLPPLTTHASPVGLQRVADGLTAPIGVVDPADGSGRLFIYEQHGLAVILRDGAIAPEPFLDIRSRTLSDNPGFDERGFIGFALHPDFAENGLVYTYSSEEAVGEPDFPIEGADINHHGVVAEWQVDPQDPDQIDPGTRRELLRFDEPQFNHNGGQLLFAPDGYLYIGLGDGGGANDNEEGHGEVGNGQNPLTLLGSVLRIDPAGSNSANGSYGIPADNPFVGDPGGLDEIYAYGFRNPFRMSYDPFGERILVADVGQNNIEEINVLQKGGNYGWRVKEGSFFFDPATGNIGEEPFEPEPEGLIEPIAQYDHDEGASIIGGFIYGGSLLPEFRGNYLFGDFGTSFEEPSGQLFAMSSDNEISRLALGLNARELGAWVKGFGQDARGEIYLCSSTELAPTGSGGQVWRLIPLAHLNAFEPAGESSLRIEVLADEDGGEASLLRSTDLVDFSDPVPLDPIAPSLFESIVPVEEGEAFYRADLAPSD